MFHSPPGYTTTNNPIESYNKTIKAYFTNRIKVNLIPAFKIFGELIHFESSVDFNYKTSILVTKKEENNAKKLISSKFVKMGEHVYNYCHKNGTTSTINCGANCTCKFYADKGKCLHLIRVALIEEKDLPGMQIHNTFSIHKRRKLQAKKLDAFEIDDDEFEISITGDEAFSDEDRHNNDDNQYDTVAATPDNDVNDDNAHDDDENATAKTNTVVPLKIKRGRPPKIKSTLVISPVKIVKKMRTLPKRQCKKN